MGHLDTLASVFNFHFLYVDAYSFPHSWLFPAAQMPYSMVRYITAGGGVFTIDGVAYPVRKHDIAYIPEGSVMSCRADAQGIRFISVRVSLLKVHPTGDLLSAYFHVPPVTHCTDPAVLKQFQEALASAVSHSNTKLFRIRGMLNLIFAYLVESALEKAGEHAAPPALEENEALAALTTAEEAVQLRDSRINALVQYLVDHPEKQLNTQELCRIADLSPSAMRRLFKKGTGKTPGAFIRDLRLMTAARRLLVSEEQISLIAYELGYESANYFSRVFKEKFGLSPGAYRAAAR